MNLGIENVSNWLLYVPVNYGNLVLQALLEHWWRPLANDEDQDGQGDSPSAGSNTHTRGGNEYFSVPGHTPVILRFVQYRFHCPETFFVNLLQLPGFVFAVK